MVLVRAGAAEAANSAEWHVLLRSPYHAAHRGQHVRTPVTPLAGGQPEPSETDGSAPVIPGRVRKQDHLPLQAKLGLKIKVETVERACEGNHLNDTGQVLTKAWIRISSNKSKASWFVTHLDPRLKNTKCRVKAQCQLPFPRSLHGAVLAGTAQNHLPENVLLRAGLMKQLTTKATGS